MSRFPSRSLLLTAAVSGLALGGTLWVKPALAGTATGNITISASVPASCTLQTAPIAFGDASGAYDSVNGSNASSGAIRVTCTNGSSATITLSQGANANSGSSDADPLRRMKLSGGNDYLPYQLYQDSAKTTTWGNTSGTGVTYTGTGSSETVTVYGEIPPGLNSPVGSYTDTVVATVSY